MNAELDSFESQLLTALRDHVDTEPSARAHILSGRRRLVAATGAVAAAVAGVMFFPGLGGGPAYSVQEGNSGRIVVEVNRFEDAPGLEEALADHGVTAQITYVPDGGQCLPGRYFPIDRQGIALEMGSDLFKITLEPGTIRAGEVLVVDASILRVPDSTDPVTGVESTHGSRVTVQADVAQAPVPACVPAISID